MLITTLCPFLAFLVSLIADDREIEREILQPFFAISPSGAWRLEVEPSDRWERVTLAGLTEELSVDHGTSLGLSPDGETILAVDRRTYTLHRYPLE